MQQQQSNNNSKNSINPPSNDKPLKISPTSSPSSNNAVSNGKTPHNSRINSNENGNRFVLRKVITTPKLVGKSSDDTNKSQLKAVATSKNQSKETLENLEQKKAELTETAPSSQQSSNDLKKPTEIISADAVPPPERKIGNKFTVKKVEEKLINKQLEETSSKDLKEKVQTKIVRVPLSFDELNKK